MPAAWHRSCARAGIAKWRSRGTAPCRRVQRGKTLLCQVGAVSERGLYVQVPDVVACYRCTGIRGPVAKFFRARFVTELFSAEPVLTQLGVEIRLSGRPVHN